jgi:hypothetical protein
MGQDIARLSAKAIGLFAYFAEDGTDTDDDPAQTISETVLPDDNPTTNWKSLGDILEGATRTTETADDSYNQLVGDRFVKRHTERVIGDYLNFETRQMNQLVEAMELGVSPAFAEDTNISPFTVIDRAVKGWLLLQARKLGSGGVDDHRIVCWVELRLTGIPMASDNKAQKPGLRAQMLPNALNSLRFLAPV